MDIGTIIFWGVVVLIVWSFFSKNSRPKATVTYKDPKTGEQKTETKQFRKPQNQLVIDKPDPFEISEEIQEVLDILENTNTNVFLTGKAGTGKSTLLRYFRATTSKNPVVVAPTGVAAVNVQGQTIHSFFSFGPGITPERVRRVSYERARVFRNMQMLIIDEISMVRADLFECIDRFLRLNTGKPNLPFGGVQIVAIGDLYQLPPVLKNSEKGFFEKLYKSPFFFSTEAFKNGKFKKFELNTVHRQKGDPAFVQALNAIREGIPTSEHMNLLNTAVVSQEPENLGDYIHLVTTNKMAKEINDSRMESLPAEPITYIGAMFGTFSEQNAPTDLELILKPGAQVMLLNNDRQRRWVNGDIVRVLETRPETIFVEFSDGSVDEIRKYTWETVRFVFDEEEQKIIPKKVGGFTQLPVKPAWAVTIHKGQGKTFERAFVDLGSGAFAEGQAYVALSRCKSLEGLKLAAPLTSEDVFINKHVRDFMAFAYPMPSSVVVSRIPEQKQAREITENQKGERPIIKEVRQAKNSRDKLSQKEFVLQAIKNLRTKNYKGIHVVFSGFNEAFREYFGEDPVKAVGELEKEGVVVIRPVKGGAMLYDAEEYISNGPKVGKKDSKALGKILGH